MSRILAARDVHATCPKARFTDSRLRVSRGIPTHQTGSQCSNILLFDDDSSKIKRHLTH
jgi:hypothetical protein